MDAMKKTGLALGFYLAICVASIATSILAWFLTTRQATVTFSNISAVNHAGGMIIEEGIWETENEAIPAEESQRTYLLDREVVDEYRESLRIEEAVIEKADGSSIVVKRDGSVSIRRNAPMDDLSYRFEAIDSDGDGYEDGVEFNQDLPSGSQVVDIHYSIDLAGNNAATKPLNIQETSGDEEHIVFAPQPLTDVSGDSETFYRNTCSPYNTNEVVAVQDVTGLEKSPVNQSLGNYIQVTFTVRNKDQGTGSIDLAISPKSEGEDLLSAADESSASDEHYRMAIYDTTDIENPTLVSPRNRRRRDRRWHRAGAHRERRPSRRHPAPRKPIAGLRAPSWVIRQPDSQALVRRHALRQRRHRKGLQRQLRHHRL